MIIRFNPTLWLQVNRFLYVSYGTPLAASATTIATRMSVTAEKI